MDVLTHSLVGLNLGKAGLEKLSPYATTVCIMSANAPDIDVFSGFFGDRWTVLHYHRAITHSIVGTIALGVLIPTIFYLIDLCFSRWQKRPARIRYRGLVLVSVIAAATHPIMDWTNNYGVRPLLPWSDRWFYGDLVFIVDPYLWLVLGGAAFLLTSNRVLKLIGWAVLGGAVMLLIFRISPQRDLSETAIAFARTIWVMGVSAFILARALNLQQRVGKSIAYVALVLMLCYWSALAWMHHDAYRQAQQKAEQTAANYGEHFLRVAAMPTAASPMRWNCVAETDRAMYRFSVNLGSESSSPQRYEKPSGRTEAMIDSVETDRRTEIFLGFARFPIARLADNNCVGQTLVQFADLRYTEPGGTRGNFSLNLPVACPAP